MMMVDEVRKQNLKRKTSHETRSEMKRQKLSKDRNKSERKRQKMNKSSPQGYKKENTEAITNICPKLRDRILSFLNPQSLLNVADTCKQLQVAAAAKFGLDYGDGSIKFALFPNEKDVPAALDSRIGHFMDVVGKAILPFLRCFGATISKLRVYGTDSRVNRYINHFCADTLTSIDFYDNQKEQFAMGSFLKSFTKVEEIVIRSDFPNLGKQFSYFDYWFPNLRRVNIYAPCFDKHFKAATFPHLDWLAVWGDFYGSNTIYMEKHVGSFLRANRQLKTLKLLNLDFTFAETMDLISGNTMISELEWSSRKVVHINADELFRLANEHPNIVDLRILNQSFLKAMDVIGLVSNLYVLKSFQFQLKRSEYNRLRDELRSVMNFGNINYFYSMNPEFIIVMLKFHR